DDVDSFLKAYGQYHGFAIIKKRVEQRDDGTIKHRSFGCEFGGKYTPQKSIDINVHLTMFKNAHNHKLNPENCKYSAKFRSIEKDALNDIEFYTKSGNLSITVQCQLLRAKYPDTTFLDMDLANAIQHYKVKSRDLEADALHLLSFLTEKHSESGWSIEFELDKKYPSASNYLTRVLYSSRQSWACAFTSKIFTTGVQTTSCVKGYNGLIKRILHSNGSLCDLLNILDSRLEKEAEWNRFFEYQTLSSCVGISSVGNEIFPTVDQILSEYLTPHILSVERIEMAQCLYFNANVVFSNKGSSQAQQSQTIPLIPQQFTVPPSVATSSRCAATRRSKFCEIWGLARQAAQLAIDCDDNEMIQWLRTFINQKKYCLTQTDECENSDKENDLTVANPPITKHKGRPGTKRYKATTEKSSRQPYTCRSCDKTGHNSARCQKKGGV
ncbi:1963_t:CDS:2, partial [Racocetra persica]